jgi:hypothetical protein
MLEEGKERAWEDMASGEEAGEMWIIVVNIVMYVTQLILRIKKNIQAQPEVLGSRLGSRGGKGKLM